MPSPEKFHETLEEHEVGKEVIALIDSGFEGIVSKAKKKTKAEFFIQALEIMEDKLGIQKTREIFEANGCCKSGARLKASKEFGVSMQTYVWKINLQKYGVLPI